MKKMLETNKITRTQLRTCSGFSLVTMLAISMIATLVVSGLLAGILPVFRTVSSDKSKYQLKNFAEAASDYVLAKLNDPDFKSQVAPSDDLTSEPKKQVTVTSNDLGLPGSMSAIVTISNDMPPSDSRLFNPGLSPYGYVQEEGGSITPIMQSWSMFAKGSKTSTTNYAWRKITSEVKYLGLTETVAVAAQIDYSVSPGESNPATPRAFFQNAAVATQTIEMLNGSSTSAYADSSESPIKDAESKYNLGGDIAANYRAKFDGTANEVGGNLDVPSIEAPGGISASNGGLTKINRFLTVNQTVQSFTPSDVLGKLFPSETPPSRPNIQVEQNNAQAELPPAPGVPDVASQPLTPSPGSTLKGSYYASSLEMTSGNLNGENARIFIQDNGSTGRVMNLTGNINGSPGTSPSQFQIWYNGRGTLTINTGSTRATIYAPYAKVELSGIGTSKGAFKGAVVARDLSLSNVDVSFDKTLASQSSLQFDATKLNKLGTFKVVGYKEVPAVK